MMPTSRDGSIGDSRPFDVKFCLIAILFLVFDVELLFLYPGRSWPTAPTRCFPSNCVISSSSRFSFFLPR